MTSPAVYADSGLFVCFEGGDGGGKSTQSQLLLDWVTSLGHTALLTRQPGGTAVGQEFRRIVLSPETGNLSPRTEALAYAADKAEHVDAVVRPALERGEVVEEGRHEDLLARGGRYAAMWARQSAEEDAAEGGAPEAAE